MTRKRHDMDKFLVDESSGTRLDLWLGERVGLTRSQIKRLVDQRLIEVNGVTQKAGYRVQKGDEIKVEMPMIPKPSLEPEPIPLEIVYEDQDLAVINKPKGLVVHPGAGHLNGTLVNALLYHLDELAEGEDPKRPGIVHRLDKETSGLMMIAKSNESYLFLKHQLKARQVQRKYLALVQGVMSVPEGIIDKPIGRHMKERKKMAIREGAREAQTIFAVQELFRKHSLVNCGLITGRTHQIRVHLASIHHPIVGDPLYGFKVNNLGAKSQILHAASLVFDHPKKGRMEFNSDPGQQFWEVVEKAAKIN